MKLHPDGAACMAEEDLGIQLEEWDGSEENQDAPAISAIEDSLLFESKNVILWSLQWQYERVKTLFPVYCSEECLLKRNTHGTDFRRI